jgi:hypothetical protein
LAIICVGVGIALTLSATSIAQAAAFDASAPRTQTDPSASPPPIRMITRAGLRELLADGSVGRKAAQTLFGNRNAFIIIKPGQSVPSGWKAHAALIFETYGSFATAVGRGLPHGVSAVVYDNEPAYTSAAELGNARSYSARFARLAHAHNLTYIAAPTPDYFAADAHSADIIDIQAQSREAHGPSYYNRVLHEAAVAHHENGNVKVITQVTANPNHVCPGISSGNCSNQQRERVVQDLADTVPHIDGYLVWTSIKNGKTIRNGDAIAKKIALRVRKGAKL